MQKKRKILVSAYGCEPNRGSEAGVGWNWVLQMAHYNELWVITRRNDKEKIESNIPTILRENLHFVYYDTCDLIKKIKRREKGLYFYYWCWQIGIIPIIKRLTTENHFDYAMHLSFGSLWMPTFLPFFNVPFIWGPVGGADGVPKNYIKVLPLKQRIIQTLRYALIKTTKINPLVDIPSKAAVAILGRTQNNIDAIPSKYKNKGYVILETAMESSTFDVSNIGKSTNGCVEIISTGRLVPFKNIAMGVKIVGQVIADGYDVHYTIIGDGSERKRIESLIKELSIEKYVTLLGEVSRSQVMEKLGEADIYLFPSLREGGSWALMEAMAAKLPVVCFNWTGTGIITDDECACRINPSTPENDLISFAKALEDLVANREKRESFGNNARRKIQEKYAWDEKAVFMNHVFDDIEGKSNG